jgi:uncharacterized protein involved in outer membrane biogenesis
LDLNFFRSAGVIRWLRVLKPYLIALAAVLGGYLLFGWLALPGILQSQAEKYIERTGYRLTMDRPSFNPLLLDLRIKNLRLTEPDGKPLLSFKGLLIDFSPLSAFRRAYVFNEIRLEGPSASVEVLPRDRLNWSDLIEALQSKEQNSPEAEKSYALPRLIIRKFSLVDGSLDFADRRTAPDRSASLVPLDVELTDLSTLPNKKGKYELTAKTNFGAAIHWDGQVALNPVSIAGGVRVDDLPLAKLATFLPLPPTLGAPKGTATLSTQYQAGMVGDNFDVRLDDLSVGIDGFRVQGKTDPNASLTLDHIDLKGGRFDLLDHRIAVDSIAASGGGIKAERTASGRINLLDLLPAEKKAVAASKSAPSAATAGWHYRVEHTTVRGFSAGFRDRTIDPAADLALQGVTAEVSGVSEDMTKPLPVHLAFRSRDGGNFSAEGTVVPADASADLQIKLDDLAIKPAQPYLGHWTTLKLVDGTLSTEGHATYGAEGGQYAGSLALQNLRIVEGDGRPFLAWKSLAAPKLSVSSKGVAVRELLLNGFDTRLIIAKDKSVNLTKVLRQQPSNDGPSASPAQAAPSPFEVRVGRLQIQRSQLEFADQSLALPFGTHIHALNGTIDNISSKRRSAPAQLKLKGQIDNYGTAQAEGRLDLFKPTDLLDIKVAFNNVEMTRLTPYSATFAGRRIDSGKLTLNLHYGIKDRRLTGDNQVVMDRLTLGERVESPDAVDLPLDLAIAILKDSDGRINLGVPISGSLDDPQFSYGGIIWKAFANVVTDIVTSPLRALGSLFGGDKKKFHGFVFEPGRPALSPPERERLVHFADALNRRPNLAVTVHGTWSDADRVALQDLALRKQLAGKLGLSTKGDPGPITPDHPRVKAALEDLYADRFGSGALAALKEGYRKANPGKLPETTGGQMMSVLTGIIGTKPSLSEQDIDAMKGTDFYALLYQKLRDAEAMPDAQLQALAQARGERIMKELNNAHAPLDRVTLQAVEKVDANDDGIPLKLKLAPVGQTQAKAAGEDDRK